MEWIKTFAGASFGKLITFPETETMPPFITPLNLQMRI